MNRSHLQRFINPASGVFLGCLIAALAVGRYMTPTWLVEKIPAVVEMDDDLGEVALVGSTREPLSHAAPAEESQLTVENLTAQGAQAKDLPTQDFVYETTGDGERSYYFLTAQRHWGWWSFLPAMVAIALCWITKEPITALLAGVVVGAALIGKINVLDEVLVPSIGTVKAATILVLYLWLLGGLTGIWARTGAMRAFAEFVSRRFVVGPRSAKVVAWMLGVAFFQGGTVSSVLVGTTVRPVADKQRVSHEELSLIVDATSSPIAVILAFNAWPIYVQALIGVSGVAYLATKNDRLAFFFYSVPYSFYAMFSVLFTLLLAVELMPWMPAKLTAARHRARETGELDAPDAEPLAMGGLMDEAPPENYPVNPLDFLLPLVVLLGIAVGTYAVWQSPQVLWAFCAALFVAALMAAAKGMTLRQIVSAVIDGQKSVVLGSVILLLAITVGGLSQETGGGQFLVSLLGDFQWYWLLPATLFALAVVIAFSTGTSWATFAVTMPLAMPLAHAVGVSQELTDPKLFQALCFAACLNGGVFGDQCSPISDTTVLSSMSTGADLMDHVTTQIPVAGMAAGLALLGWTGLALWSV